MHVTSPRTVMRWGARAALGSGTVALLLLVAWAARWHWEWLQLRPQLVLMLYLLALLCAVAAACVALLAACHLAIHHAFRAGVETGMAAADPPGRRRRSKDPLLQLVE